ncbi:hypothetical protein [Kordia jejudonensis]|uniref:hypothetical protein n=1 Tax=Kordia jejudonensis TaxID=1348245 RepID=UPI0006297F23|nr:hypothetical protein [Kordia jejudonensis]
MKTPKKHSVQSSIGTFNYLNFENVSAFNEFVDYRVERLSNHNLDVWRKTLAGTQEKINNSSDWYGTPIVKNLSELESHKSFLGMHLLKEIEPLLKDQFSKYLANLETRVLPKPKIAYNDRGLGIFCFDRAAMGLYKGYQINTSSSLDLGISQLNIALGNKKVKTSVKNVYAHFENRNSNLPSLELNIVAGGNAGVKGNNLLYIGLASSLLVEFMELRDIPVEVYVLFETSFSGQNIVSKVRVKRFQDRLDKNQLLLMGSDPRYFRYRGFKSLIAISDYFDLNISYGLGSSIKNIGKSFVKTTGSNAFVFEQSYSLNSAVSEVNRIITNYKNKLDEKGS